MTSSSPRKLPTISSSSSVPTIGTQETAPRMASTSGLEELRVLAVASWNGMRQRLLVLLNRRNRLNRLSWALLATAALSAACDGAGTLVTVYSRSMATSIPVPAGWSTEVGSQGGFLMQIFTCPSVDVPERAGIRVQVMTGPMPAGRSLDELSKRYIEDQEVSDERSYSLHGFEGKTWTFVSQDEAESSRLLLISVEETLYGIYARGEAPTVEAHGPALDAMWDGFSLERE